MKVQIYLTMGDEQLTNT